MKDCNEFDGIIMFVEHLNHWKAYVSCTQTKIAIIINKLNTGLASC